MIWFQQNERLFTLAFGLDCGEAGEDGEVGEVGEVDEAGGLL